MKNPNQSLGIVCMNNSNTLGAKVTSSAPNNPGPTQGYKPTCIEKYQNDYLDCSEKHPGHGWDQLKRESCEDSADAKFRTCRILAEGPIIIR